MSVLVPRFPPLLKRKMVRVDRIELTQPAWKAGVLPLNYTRDRIEWINIDLILIRSSPFRAEFSIRMEEEGHDGREFTEHS